MKKIYPFLTVLIIVLVVLWQIFFSNTNYYLVSVLIIIVIAEIFISGFYNAIKVFFVEKVHA